MKAAAPCRAGSRRTLLAAFAAVLSLSAAPGGARQPPEALAARYRTARAYEIAATARTCADASLQPRVAATVRRMERARRAMTAAYGSGFLSAPEAPVVIAGSPCADPGAAARSAANFAIAVGQLERALARRPRR